MKAPLAGSAMCWTAFMLMACTSKDPESTDSSPPGINLPHDTGPEAECEPNIRYTGDRLSERSDPRVGETWNLFMWCDNALVQGPSVLQINPTSLATIDSGDRTVTWQQAGSGTVFLQVGSMQSEEPIEVQD
jgi:hypothetical protein